ncbi:hypothetical protein MNBD_ALPHA09-1960 [hydrothermal vent metagenome]|uniref:L,D-TPase catalytic domain-containing protein n=1 Tax=hydrothermal vent metagenome TaxID=652676 RepID=A0A3B0UDT1_9ZZZZ
MKACLTAVFSSVLLASVLVAPVAQAQEAAPEASPLLKWLSSLAPDAGTVESGSGVSTATVSVTPIPHPPAAKPNAEIKVAAATSPGIYAPRVYTVEDIFGTSAATATAKPEVRAPQDTVLVASAAPQVAPIAKKPVKARKKANMKTWKSKLKTASTSRKRSASGLDPKFDRTEVSYDTKYKVGTIVIDTDAKFLYLVQPEGKALRWGVGVGRQGFSWKGTAKIKRKAEWPTWTPPAAMRKREPWLPARMEGGPDNPLGARAMYLYKGGRDTLYRIHGTNNPATIGKAVSSGCIRLINDAVADLYDRTKMGATVVVL